MTHVDYKYKWITRDAKETCCRVSFYSGEYVTEEDKQVYKRNAVIETKEFTFPGDLSDEELNKEINKELDSRKGDNETIEGQKIA